MLSPMESLQEMLGLSWIETVYGRYAVLTQREGRLLPEAETLLRRAVQQTGADCLYADAAAETREGLHPIYKPTLSPDTLLSYPYVGSPLFLSERLWQRVSNLSDGEAAPADRHYALSVRAVLLAERVEHLPQILFHGAEPPLPTKPDAPAWGLRALCRQGAVGQGLLMGSFAARYSVRPRGRLSVIVRANGNAGDLRRTLEAFELRTACLDYELLIAAGGLLSEQERRYCAMLKKHGAAKLCYLAGETNDARIKNRAAAQAGGEYLLFLQAGTEPDSTDAAERLISHAQQRRCGAIGGILCAADGTWLQSELFVDAEDRPVPRRSSGEQRGVFDGRTVPDACIRNVTLLGGDAFLLRTDVFLESGGFDETFDCCWCEAALALSMSQRGLYNVCTPYARFLQHGVRRTALSRRNGERCTDVFRALRVHGDSLVSQNAAYLRERAETSAAET